MTKKLRFGSRKKAGRHMASQTAEPKQTGKTRLRRNGYRLTDLIKQCEPGRELTEEDRQWLDALPVGEEEL
jgi:hypothetical protein